MFSICSVSLKPLTARAAGGDCREKEKSCARRPVCMFVKSLGRLSCACILILEHTGEQHSDPNTKLQINMQQCQIEKYERWTKKLIDSHRGSRPFRWSSRAVVRPQTFGGRDGRFDGNADMDPAAKPNALRRQYLSARLRASGENKCLGLSAKHNFSRERRGGGGGRREGIVEGGLLHGEGWCDARRQSSVPQGDLPMARDAVRHCLLCQCVFHVQYAIGSTKNQEKKFSGHRSLDHLATIVVFLPSVRCEMVDSAACKVPSKTLKCFAFGCFFGVIGCG
ncbi:hypothetical protein CEXT_432561 [Caerostris extrusa]|uniref:Uncharacterized protein n=1 Tax=Caerostris extrusa TaxID=172846 RepID=A0AAV4TRK3_CAEEX|nr:hypothetical protein CEXT_432561 [Caerostris extrusa]